MLEICNLALLRGAFRLQVEHLQLPPGQNVSIIGPSGSGKSSLLRALLGFERDARFSTLQWYGSELANSPPHARPFGWLSQDLGLWPQLTAGQHLAFARSRGKSLRPQSDDQALLERVGLGHKVQSRPDTLSGGERQRLAFARVFAARPAIALLDEPFSNLDPVTAEKTLSAFTRLSTDLGVQSIRVTHWMQRPRDDEHFWVIEHGTVSQQGRWSDLKAKPSTPWIERVISLHA